MKTAQPPSLLLLFFLLLSPSVGFAQSTQTPLSPKLPTKTLSIGVHLIQAEIAASETEKQKGLMYRKSLGKNEGMLFVYPEAQPVCMWMKNTYVPLSVAFIDGQGKIVNVADMAPLTTKAHCASHPVPYALEMRRGWFREKHLGPGSLVTGLQLGR